MYYLEQKTVWSVCQLMRLNHNRQHFEQTAKKDIYSPGMYAACHHLLLKLVKGREALMDKHAS